MDKNNKEEDTAAAVGVHHAGEVHPHPTTDPTDRPDFLNNSIKTLTKLKKNISLPRVMKLAKRVDETNRGTIDSIRQAMWENNNVTSKRQDNHYSLKLSQALFNNKDDNLLGQVYLNKEGKLSKLKRELLQQDFKSICKV